MLCSRCLVSGAWFQVLGSGCLVPCAWFRLTEYKVICYEKFVFNSLKRCYLLVFFLHFVFSLLFASFNFTKLQFIVVSSLMFFDSHSRSLFNDGFHNIYSVLSLIERGPGMSTTLCFSFCSRNYLQLEQTINVKMVAFKIHWIAYSKYDGLSLKLDKAVKVCESYLNFSVTIEIL